LVFHKTSLVESKIMSDRSEKDRWNELADLLGLPPDQKAPQSAAPPAAPPPPSHPPAASPPEAPKRRHVEPSPEFAAAEVPARDVVEPPEPMEAPPASAASTEREPVREEEAEHGRRGGRRRGRGHRNDGRDRDNHSRRGSPAGEDNGDAESANGEHARVDSSDREEPISRGDLDEEILEPEEAEISEPVAEEDDDEEIDKLTDWNVPSWSELIGSLYRPER
jgi:hypothetical protein